MERSVFKIFKMDCPSEEQLIRLKLGDFQGILKLDFNIPDRTLEVYHTGDSKTIDKAIKELNLHSRMISTETARLEDLESDENRQRNLLWTVMLINFFLFCIEIVAGFLADSMGLVADSLDMLTDAFVYGLSIFAVGGLASTKKRIARLSGYFQLTLAILGFAEVIRRFMGYEEIPGFQTMIAVSILALAGNIISLYILQKSKSQEAHMKASMICTSNDVIANAGVIVAGIAVYFTNSILPDLIVGSVVFFLVARGAVRILRFSN